MSEEQQLQTPVEPFEPHFPGRVVIISVSFENASYLSRLPYSIQQQFVHDVDNLIEIYKRDYPLE